MSYKLAIFDMDGTILDTLDDLADSTNYALAAEGLPARTKDEVRRFVGNGMRKLIERAVPEGCDPDTAEKVLETYSVYYPAHAQIKTKPYDGIPEMLDNLKKRGCRLAVLSNKPDGAVKQLSEKYFGGIFDVSAGEKPEIPRKPAPDGIYCILRDMGMAKEDAVYIGDSEVDIQTAKNAGIPCISVDWGFRPAELLREHGAEKIVSDAKALEEAIME